LSLKNRGKETPVHKLTRTCSIEASHRASISRQRTAGKCRSFLDAQSSGSPHAVASAPRAEAPDKPGHAPGPMNRRLRIPFQYPQCQRARRSPGGSFQPTIYKTDLRKARAYSRTFGPAENAGYMRRARPKSNAFAVIPAFFSPVSRMPHPALARDRDREAPGARPGAIPARGPPVAARSFRIAA